MTASEINAGWAKMSGAYTNPALLRSELVEIPLPSVCITPSVHIADYMMNALSIDLIVERAREQLAGKDFDTIVCRGVSGLLVAPVLAYALKKKIGVVRKPDPSSHSSRKYEGHPDVKRWLFVDDLISSGNTLRATKKVVQEEFPTSALVGSFLYDVYNTANDQSRQSLFRATPADL